MAFDFRFENVEVLKDLWILPTLLGVAIFFSYNAKKKLVNALGSKAYANLTKTVHFGRRRTKVTLQLLVILLMFLSLARPQMGDSLQEIKSEGVEVMLAIDVSDSMLAEDVRPNRLEQAKTEMAKLIEKLPGSKIGVVAFAGSAALLSPLTHDPAALRMYIDSLSPTSVSSQGTNFKAAIEEASESFKRGGVETDEVTQVTRVIILASDGEDHEPGALEQAQEIAKKGTRIFSLIYGTENGANIPERDGMGYLRGYKKDRNGQTILTTVKGDALTAIAKAGQGLALFANFGGQHIDQVVAGIEQLEKSQFDATMAVQYEERFQFFAILALLLLLLELFMGERKTQRNPWVGRFVTGWIVVVLSQLSPDPAQAQVSWQVYNKNRMAVQDLEKGQAQQAQNSLLQALAHDPLNGALHFNLGLSFEALSLGDKAKASYLQTLKNAQSPIEKFSALFNLGLIEQKAKQKDLALNYYQQALEIIPDSREVKINIELLTNKSQNQKGEGQSDSKDENDQQQNSDGKGQDSKDDKNQDPPKENQPKNYKKNQPQQFKSQELSEGDVKKILGEIKQQEQKIRAEFNKKESKEPPKDKDW